MPGKLRSASKAGSDGAEENMETQPKPSEKVSLGGSPELSRAGSSWPAL